MGMQIVIADDDALTRRLLRALLTAAGHQVLEAADGEAAWALLQREGVSLLITDWQMPRLDGPGLIRRIREAELPGYIYSILLTSRDSKTDTVAGLDCGADDYLTKPFGMEELLARIRVALRRANRAASGDPVLDFGRLRIDLAARVVTLDGEEVHLTPTEYELLRELATNAGKVMTHQMLLTRVWGPASEGSTNYLRVYINQLRHKLEPDAARPRYILTDPGVGYRFRPAGDDGARS